MAVTFRQWLQERANNGDQASLMALQYTGDDGVVDPSKAGWETPMASLLNSGNNYEKAQSFVNSLANEYTAQTQSGGGNYTGSGDSGYASRAAQEAQDARDRADAIASIDDSIGVTNSAIGRLTNQNKIGTDNINNSYVESLNSLTSQKGKADRDFNLQKTRSTQDFVEGRANLRSDAGNQFNSLRRLLAAAGAGGSTAYSQDVGLAVGKEAQSRFGQVEGGYKKNNQNMDIARGDYLEGYDNERTGLEKQKTSKLKELQSGLATNEATLRDTLARLQIQRGQAQGQTYASARGAATGEMSRIQQLLDSVDNYGKQYSGAVQLKTGVKYAAPELNKYEYNRFNTPEAGQRTGNTDSVGQFYQLLGNKEEKEKTV